MFYSYVVSNDSKTTKTELYKVITFYSYVVSNDSKTDNIKLKFSGFGGDGTHKCYFTSKDVIDLYLFKFCVVIEAKKDLYIENSDSAALETGLYNVFVSKGCAIIQCEREN